MKRVIFLFVLISLLSGCAKSRDSMDRALDMRKQIVECNNCTFDLCITADYVDYTYEFRLQCEMDKEGCVAFSVIEPDSISGIRGTISARGGELTFDEKVLMFPMMADGALSPVSAPWLMMNALRSGYIKGVEELPNGMLLQIDDSFEGENLQINITVDVNGLPAGAEVFWQERRVIIMIVENFHIM